MTKFLQKYLKPSQITKLYMLLALAAVMGISIAISSMTTPERREFKPKAKVTNIITTTKSRDMGLDAVADKLKQMEKDMLKQQKEVERLRDENTKLKKNTSDSALLAAELVKTKGEVKKLQALNSENSQTLDSRVNAAVTAALKERKVEQILNGGSQSITRPEFVQSVSGDSQVNLPVPSRKTSSSGSNDQQSPFRYGSTQVGTQSSEVAVPLTEARNENLLMVIESESVVNQEDDDEIYLPKGAILTGVLITGVDAPTTSSAQDNPMPVLVRIKKEAILPNFVTLNEVRECFALMAGYGDLGSERAHFRGEGITCVKHDGNVIEKTFGSYAVGEDGKAGIKGTLVTRNSTVLANTMMAGFASGLASAFNVTPVPVIATESSGTQQYQDVFSASAVQGGVARGASKSMDKLADYYLKLADAMHPVIEISAGRTVDMVITQGTVL